MVRIPAPSLKPPWGAIHNVNPKIHVEHSMKNLHCPIIVISSLLVVITFSTIKSEIWSPPKGLGEVRMSLGCCSIKLNQVQMEALIFGRTAHVRNYQEVNFPIVRFTN